MGVEAASPAYRSAIPAGPRIARDHRDPEYGMLEQGNDHLTRVLFGDRRHQSGARPPAQVAGSPDADTEEQFGDERC
jgi:hypothetical protein